MTKSILAISTAQNVVEKYNKGGNSMIDFSKIEEYVNKDKTPYLIGYDKVGDYLITTFKLNENEFKTKICKNETEVVVQHYRTIKEAIDNHTIWRIKCLSNPKELYDIDLDRNIVI